MESNIVLCVKCINVAIEKGATEFGDEPFDLRHKNPSFKVGLCDEHTDSNFFNERALALYNTEEAYRQYCKEIVDKI